ncbi:MAG: hypothetical protein ACI4XB_03580 [Ruminococcus sp.]
MTCFQCGSDVPINSRFCPVCGAAMPVQPQPVYTPQFAAAPQKKQRKVWPWVLGISLTLIVLLFALLMILFFTVFRTAVKEEVICETADYCACVMANGEGLELGEELPAAFWDYLVQTYNVSRETIEDGLEDYLNSDCLYASDSPEADYAWLWEYDTFELEDMDDSRKSHAKACMQTYGLTADGYQAAEAIAQLSKKHVGTFSMVRIDDGWYVLDAMEMTDMLCQTMYGADSAFRQLTDQYWAAYAAKAPGQLSEMVHGEFPGYLAKEYQLDTSEAETAMGQYLDLFEDISEVGTMEQITYNVEEVLWYSWKTKYNMPDFGFSIDRMVDVSMTYTIEGTEGKVRDDTYLTLAEIDGKWYLYDAMYDYDMVCYVYVTGGFESYYDDSDVLPEEIIPEIDSPNIAA